MKGKSLSLIIKHLLGRTLLIVLLAGVVAGCIYTLSKSPFATTLTQGMNFSLPLIVLNAVAQGVLGESNRGRSSFPIPRGLMDLAREILVLAILVDLVSAIQYLSRRRRRRNSTSPLNPRLP